MLPSVVLHWVSKIFLKYENRFLLNENSIILYTNTMCQPLGQLKTSYIEKYDNFFWNINVDGKGATQVTN